MALPSQVAVAAATPTRLTLKVTGDGTVAILCASADLLAAMDSGPLKTLWNHEWGTQAAMRVALLETRGRVSIRPRTVVAVTTAEICGYSADVDADAATATKAELNLQMSDTTGDVVYFDLESLSPPFD